jgi:hypothetical protein
MAVSSPKHPIFERFYGWISPADDETFEAAVAPLVLCSVPDQRQALREIHRVLRVPGEACTSTSTCVGSRPPSSASSVWWTQRSGPCWPEAATPRATPLRRSPMPGSRCSALTDCACSIPSSLCRAHRTSSAWRFVRVDSSVALRYLETYS